MRRSHRLALAAVILVLVIAGLYALRRRHDAIAGASLGGIGGLVIASPLDDAAIAGLTLS